MVLGPSRRRSRSRESILREQVSEMPPKRSERRTDDRNRRRETLRHAIRIPCTTTQLHSSPHSEEGLTNDHRDQEPSQRLIQHHTPH